MVLSNEKSKFQKKHQITGGILMVPIWFRYFRPSPSSHSLSLSVHGDLHVWSALEALTILLEELSELLHLKPVPSKSMACRNLCSTVDHNRSYIMLSHLLGYTWILIFFEFCTFQSVPNYSAVLRVAVASCLSVLRTKLCDRPEVQEYSEERRPSEKSSSLFAPSPAIADCLITVPASCLLIVVDSG